MLAGVKIILIVNASTASILCPLPNDDSSSRKLVLAMQQIENKSWGVEQSKYSGREGLTGCKYWIIKVVRRAEHHVCESNSKKWRHTLYVRRRYVRGVNDAASISTPRRERFVPMVSICLYVSDLRYVSGPKLSPWGWYHTCSTGFQICIPSPFDMTFGKTFRLSLVLDTFAYIFKSPPAMARFARRHLNAIAHVCKKV